MEAEKTTLEETLSLLEERVTFFTKHQLSAENVLSQPTPTHSIRSLSEILPQLCRVGFNQTPLHYDLADIYLGREAHKSPLDQADIKFVLPPVSEGEDSIT